MMQTAKARKVENVARNKALNKAQKSRKIAFFLFFPSRLAEKSSRSLIIKQHVKPFLKQSKLRVHDSNEAAKEPVLVF